MMQGYQIVMIQQAIMLHGFSALREYWACFEVNIRFWPISETLKWLYISYRLGHYWWRLVAIDILNTKTMISLGIETMCPFEWSKGHVIMNFIVVVIPLVKFDMYSLELEYIN